MLGGSVTVNTDYTNIIFNDTNKYLIELIKYIKEKNIKSVIREVDTIIKLYGLNQEPIKDKTEIELYKKNYLNLRYDFNKKIAENKIDYAQFYVLILYGFNSQIRFNNKNQFNTPFGSRYFNNNLRNKLISFSSKLKEKNITFMTSNFDSINIDHLNLNKNDTLIYCDPPYLITKATYNQKWNKEKK